MPPLQESSSPPSTGPAPLPPSVYVILVDFQSLSAPGVVERPCAFNDAVAVPPLTVTCATTTSDDGPSSGDIQNTAPSSADRPAEAVQLVQSMPMELSAPAASPLMMPTVSQESYAVVGTAAMNAAATPPTLEPNGASDWYAGGRRHQSMSTKGAQQLQERTW